MRIKPVKKLRGGEKLAKSVLTKDKEVLITEGTILKPEYLDLMSFLGIESVCIEDPYGMYESPHSFISEEKRNKYISEVRRILENHIYQSKKSLIKMKLLAKKIVEDLSEVDKELVVDIEEYQGNLYEHTINVTIFSVMVARKMNLGEESLYQIALGCLLHDLGLRYITVPYMDYDMAIRPISEIFELKKHTILAYSALESETWIDSISMKMVLSHHERKDGSGYPLKQKVKEIECHIIQACDAFECFVSGMECKRMGIQQSMEYLVETSDVLFEGEIVNIMQKMIARYPVGTKVKLNNGEKGIVVSQTNNSIRPIIRILDKEENLMENRYDLEKNKQISILQMEQ